MAKVSQFGSTSTCSGRILHRCVPPPSLYPPDWGGGRLSETLLTLGSPDATKGAPKGAPNVVNRLISGRNAGPLADRVRSRFAVIVIHLLAVGILELARLFVVWRIIDFVLGQCDTQPLLLEVH
jgi:hypothetical protein